MNEREAVTDRERATAAVLGLSPLGASLGLALKASGRFGTVAGWDPDFDLARRSQKAGVADRYPRTAPAAVQQAAAVFLAVTTEELRDVLVAISPHLRPGTVVCSLDESQERASTLARGILPANVSFVAAHPVLGELVGGDTTPSAALFRGGVMCLSPLPSAHADAVAYIAGLAEVLTMEAFFVDAREHDAFFTGIGRLPSVLAAAYLRLVTRESSWRELGRIAGGEFRQLATMADIDPLRQQQALVGSRDHLVRWLDGLMGELGALRDALQDGREPADFYGTAAEALRKWQQNRRLPPEAADLPPPPPPVPKRRFLI